MYNSRSACSGSVSLEGFILRPQSHTLLREEVMLGDIWISGWKRDHKNKRKMVMIKHKESEFKAIWSLVTLDVTRVVVICSY